MNYLSQKKGAAWRELELVRTLHRTLYSSVYSVPSVGTYRLTALTGTSNMVHKFEINILHLYLDQQEMRRDVIPGSKILFSKLNDTMGRHFSIQEKFLR